MDLLLQLRTAGYDAVARDRRARCGDDLVDDYASRLVGHRAWVVRSREGARTFYDESLTERAGVVPPPLALLLFGRGAVHGMDGDAHRSRKLVLVQSLSADRLSPLVDLATERLERELADWRAQARPLGDLHDLLVRAYGGAALRWAGIGLPEATADDLSRHLAQVVDGFGFAGAAYPRAWRARLRADRWAAELVRRARTHDVAVVAGSPLEQVAAADLPPTTAGVELLNLLRPTVAVAWLATSAATRLTEAPEGRPARWSERLAGGDQALAWSFAQEVRRTALFVPVLASAARRDLALGDHLVRQGDRLVLDVVGIHRDVARWRDPDVFDPERFLDHVPDAFDVVAQGGGHPSGHRCPGESLALRLLGATAATLARAGVSGRARPTEATDVRRIPPRLQGDVVRRVAGRVPSP